MSVVEPADLDYWSSDMRQVFLIFGFLLLGFAAFDLGFDFDFDFSWLGIFVLSCVFAPFGRYVPILQDFTVPSRGFSLKYSEPFRKFLGHGPTLTNTPICNIYVTPSMPEVQRFIFANTNSLNLRKTRPIAGDFP